MTLDAAHTGYLASHSQGRLATIAPDGTPQNKPVSYGYNSELGIIDIAGMNMEHSANARSRCALSAARSAKRRSPVAASASQSIPGQNPPEKPPSSDQVDSPVCGSANIGNRPDATRPVCSTRYAIMQGPAAYSRSAKVTVSPSLTSAPDPVPVSSPSVTSARPWLTAREPIIPIGALPRSATPKSWSEAMRCLHA
jgi:hypothetical protein